MQKDENGALEATLLFVHGGGFCKDAWEPIIRRLEASPLLSQRRVEYSSFDFSWHGSRSDWSVQATLHLENPKAPRVSHPAKDITTWAPEEVWQHVQQLRASQRARGESDTTPLIGVGHSMGGMSLWKTEVLHPGTFAGLILFEPIYGKGSPEAAYQVDFMVSLALKREFKWANRAAAEEHFFSLRNFARWDRESLAAYLRGALVEEQDGSISLACHPEIEASLYCHTPMYLSDELLQHPRCGIYFQGGGRSKPYNVQAFEDLAARFPSIYKIHKPLDGLSHALVLEDPAQCADAALKDLAELLPPEQVASSNFSRL